MIELYCRGYHQTQKFLCEECRSLLAYAEDRLDKCPYQEQKPTCAKCPIHCYKPEMRHNVRAVMKYSGPRMIYRHPVEAFRHLMDERRSAKQ